MKYVKAYSPKPGEKIHSPVTLSFKDRPHNDESMQDQLGCDLTSSIALFLVYLSRCSAEETNC